MYINAISWNFPKNNSTKTNKFKTKPIPYDSLSFSSMKKSQFQGIDLAIVEKFKAPIEKFNGNDDFQKWCRAKVEELKPDNKDYSARQEIATVQRKEMLNEWFDYVINENDAYTDSISLLILDSITKGLDSTNDDIPPVLNKGVLADTIFQIESQIKEDLKAQINFNKSYQINLSNISYTDLKNNLNSNKTGWIIIPSKKRRAKNFEKNVERLKILSHPNWCTKSYNAEPYLKLGDFHIYMKNGKPKLGVRFEGKEIQEIQGEKNDSRIPVSYLNTVLKHIEDNSYKLSSDAQEEIKLAQEAKSEVEKLENELKEQGVDFKTCSTEQLFNVIGIGAEVDNDGLLIIEKYCQPSDKYTYDDIGINEDKLFKDIKEIKENADFRFSQVTNLGNLQRIGRDARFRYSRVINLGNLQSIGRDVDFTHSQIRNLGNLQSIGRNANFRFSKVTNLGKLQIIRGGVEFRDSKVTSLGNLQTIGTEAYFTRSQVIDLGNLQTIGGNAKFNISKITDLGNLQTIGGNAEFADSPIKSLGNLQSIGKNAFFGYSNVVDLGNLQTIGGNSYCKDSEITDFDRLKSITKGEVILDK